MPIKACNKRCSGCALTPDAVANLEPHNFITAQLAVLAPFPFYCHENLNYDLFGPGHSISPKIFRENGLVLCSGWLEEVKKLAATGYYKENAMVTKCFGQMAYENLCIFLQDEDPEEKEDARELLTRVLTRLNDKRLKFESQEVAGS